MKSHSQKKIIDFIKKNSIATSSEIAKLLDVSWNTADKGLMELAFEGKIERIKKKGVTLWVKK